MRAIPLLILAAAAAGPARADVPLPPPPRHYVADSAGLLSESDAQRLDQKLWRFDEETSNQVIVAIFRELTSPSLEDFTVRTAQAWRVGRKKLDNGVVLFVFVNDRKIRLEVGYGLEGALPDALARRIIEENITPSFKAGNYAQGLEAGVDAIIAATRGEYRPEPKSQGALILVVLGGLMVLIFGIAALLPRLAPRATYDSAGLETLGVLPSLGYLPWRRRRSYGYWGGGSRSGSGGSWGGFSGGGGGFGGGGASGGW